jgi:tripartite ATP-independent transporter DctM subunit
MDSVTVGVLSVLALLALLAAGVPVAITMVLIGFVSYWIIAGFQPAMGMIGMIPFSSLAHDTFTVVPMFVLMGAIAFRGGLGEVIYRFARNWVGHYPGGLAIATVFGCAWFGAISGSSVACAATIGRIALPEMNKYGYKRSLAAGSVVAAGPLDAMIPPSILMVIYASLTETSVGKLLIAGIIPGVVTAIIYAITIYIIAVIRPDMAPRASRVSWGEKLVSTKQNWGILVIFLTVIGGIYTGVCTSTEAGALGAAVALLVVFLNRTFSLKFFKETIADTAKSIGLLFFIYVGAMLFSYQFGISRIPFTFADWLVKTEISPMLVLFLIMVMYLILGTFMDTLAMIVLTMPVIFPIVAALKFDPIWFGILVVHNCEIGMITPPFGITLFAVQSVATDLPAKELIAGIWPFLIAALIALVIFIYFPGIALFLPNMMK